MLRLGAAERCFESSATQLSSTCSTLPHSSLPENSSPNFTKLKRRNKGSDKTECLPPVPFTSQP